MPQATSTTLDDSPLGPNSRYMAALRFSDKTFRGVNVINAQEKRITGKKINFLQNEFRHKVHKLDRIQFRLNQNQTKRLAYRLVLKTQTFSSIKDQKKALSKRYTADAFQNDIKEMIRFMKPNLVRERKTKIMMMESRLKYDNLLNQSRNRFNRLCPEKRTWRPGYGAYNEEDTTEQTEPEEEIEPTMEQHRERKRLQSLATLRRRNISIDSAPSSPARLPPIRSPTKAASAGITSPVKTPGRTPRGLSSSPAKTPGRSSREHSGSPVKTTSIRQPQTFGATGGGKRQGITMSMMKRQQSFLDTKERTMTPSSDKTRPKVPNDESTGIQKSDINNNEDTVGSLNSARAIDTSRSTPRTGRKLSLPVNGQLVLPPIDTARGTKRTGRKFSLPVDGQSALPSIQSGMTPRVPKRSLRTGDKGAPANMPPNL
ncbi:uncharacterized protein LOC128217957 [Mya arenaria]|nr:uncharacterized protein LOC128217957 [Mya arenaria]